MKNILLLLFCLISFGAFSQVTLERVAPLMPELYAITGDAVLEELANGDLQLRLTPDFDTPAGPDVRILLNNSNSINGALEVINLSDIGHFEGELIVPVPGNPNINDYNNIVFFCVQFNQFWASGIFGPATPPGGGGPVCSTSSVSNSNGPNTIDICPSDNSNDIVTFSNSLNVPAGMEYVYLITDENEILQDVAFTNQYNFEGTTDATQRVYGMHFNGTLNTMVGSHRLATNATGCFEHSSNGANDFITITKNACVVFVCEASTINNVGGPSVLDICPSDGQSDIVTLGNSLNLPPGANYAYLITDNNQILQEVVTNNSYNFEGSGSDIQRVYGIHYFGTLNPAIGQNRMQTTATECFEHSSSTSNDFILVFKNACFNCQNSNVFNPNGANTIDICPDDNIGDVIDFANTLGEPAGSNYIYLITDDNEIVQQAVFSNQFDFEGSSFNTQRVYGMHYDGSLNVNVGANRLQTTATNCFDHSSGNNFITITKNACITCEDTDVTDINGVSSLNICPSDNLDDIVFFANSSGLDAGSSYAYIITDANEIAQEVLTVDNFNFEGSSGDEQRVYGLRYEGTLNINLGQPRTATTASDCFTHSSSTQFLTIQKEACVVFDCLDSDVTINASSNTLDICPTDGVDDIVTISNSLNEAPGLNYAYLITDENDVLIQVVQSSTFNFEGSSLNTNRIYGIHFNGSLDAVIGANRLQTTATDCFVHSSSSSFATITKNACPPPFECLTSTITTPNGNNIDICPSDGEADIITMENSLDIAPGENYAYLITNSNDNVIDFTLESTLDFEGTNDQEQRIYGIHYDGDLNVAFGQNRLQTTASGCFEHSSATDFISVTKNDCEIPFECLESLTATTNWATSADICPSDGVDDIVELRNNLFIAPGENYVYLITDENETVMTYTLDSTYNFEGSGDAVQRVYGMHYDGQLNVEVGQNRFMTTASECFVHSGDNLFLTITKDACPDPFECMESLTATTNWATSADLCPSDGEADIVELRNNLFIAPGENYVYLITDANEVVQDYTLDSLYNFEGSGDEEQRVYGIHYSGQLNILVGQNRLMSSASGCFTHSGDNLFLTINKTGCETPYECLEFNSNSCMGYRSRCMFYGWWSR